MKKLLCAIIIAVICLGFGVSVQASSNRDPIREILGVDYTISPTEFNKPLWAWYEGEIVRWQILEINQPLNIRRFTRNDDFPYAPFGGIWGTETGDVKIATHHSGQQWLLVDIGSHPDGDYDWIRAYHAVRINVELNPQEMIDFNRTMVQMSDFNAEQREQIDWALSTFNMSRQYTSDNFYWYSNDNNSQYLPYMAIALEDRLPEIIKAFGGPLDILISIIIFNPIEYGILEYEIFNSGTGEARYGATAFWGWEHNTFKIAWNPEWMWNPINKNPIDGGFLDTLVHETVHIFQQRVITNRPAGGITWDVQRWLMEGTAHYFEQDFYGWMKHLGLLPYDRVKNDTIPSLDDISGTEAEPWEGELILYRPWGYTIIRFVVENWGFDYVIEMNRQMGYCENIFGLTRAEFERQWHRWLRVTFDPSTFYSDEELLGTWERLGTQQSLDSFTERNERNVNNWAQDILRQRGNRHQRLIFNNNRRITATSVTGFGNTWTDGSIGGRGYEIRTIGGVDFLFVNSQRTLATPGSGRGGPWTVFIRG
ncbi:MAG: hypothetical protein FWD90_05030 [Defluviitaleaceae bacterium]|nr:hypothetical protein [Defluviitaleaceae bacterium]